MAIGLDGHQFRRRRNGLDTRMFEVRSGDPVADVTGRAAQVRLDGRRAAAPDEPLVCDVQWPAPLACFTVAHRAAHPREPEERGDDEQDQQQSTDALEEPFFPLKPEVLVDLERARFLAHDTFALSQRSIGSSTRMSSPKQHEITTTAQSARPHAIPTAAASQIDAAVVSPRTDSSVRPLMMAPAPRNPTPVM